MDTLAHTSNPTRSATSFERLIYPALLQSKGIQDVATRVSGLELGGLAGSLSAGAISDYLTAKNKKEGGTKGNVGLRTMVTTSFTSRTCKLVQASLNTASCLCQSFMSDS